MQKISDSTNTANAAGEFTEGSPSAGIASTLLKAQWLNALQRELVGLVVGADMALNVNDDAQVLKAVKALAGSAADFNKLTNTPTTLGGYGITDAYTQAQLDSSLNSKAIKATTLAGYGITDAYTQSQINSSLNAKANKATTLEGYGITDAYTQAQLDSSLNSKATKATTLAGYGITDTYTQSQINSSLNAKYSTSGGIISGVVTIQASGQSITTAGLNVNNPTPGGFSVLRLATAASAATLIHSPNSNLLSARNAASGVTDLDVGTVISNGSPCHTATSFMKPEAGQFVVLNGNATLPAGGTWAYFACAYNGSGAALGGSAGIAAGGTVVGQNSNCVGFAWRIQ